MKSKIVIILLLLAIGLGIVIAIRLGYVASSGMRMTLGLLAVWALGSALKIVVETRKKKQ